MAENEMWIYDIFLEDNKIYDSMDEIFDDEDAAIEDAQYVIRDYLAEEYGRPEDNFEIVTYRE